MSWFGLLGTAKQQIDHLATRPNVRNFAGKVTTSGSIVDPAVKGDVFRPERSYFSVRIAEMRLAEAGRYFADFVPMCSCFLRYTYGRSQRTLPFVLGSETISAGLDKTMDPRAARNIQFQDIYVVRNVAMKADNLTMYTALCRFNGTGFARGLLDLFADSAGIVGGAAVGGVVHTGVDLTKRLATLLGADGVETRFGMLNGKVLDESGYRLFAGVTAANLSPGELLIENGQLVRKQGGIDATIDDVDYLVLALEHRPTLLDDDFAQVSILPFHVHFEEARSKLLAGDKASAEGTLKQLLIELGTSPDVTEADRLALVASYRSAYDLWADVSAGKSRTLTGSHTAALITRLPNSREPDVSILLESTGASLLQVDGMIRKEQAQGSVDTSLEAAHRSLTTRAIAIGKVIQENKADGTTLSKAALALLSTALHS